MVKESEINISFPIERKLHASVKKPKMLWQDVSAIFSKLIKLVGREAWNKIKKEHPKGYEVLKKMY